MSLADAILVADSDVEAEIAALRAVADSPAKKRSLADFVLDVERGIEDAELCDELEVATAASEAVRFANRPLTPPSPLPPLPAGIDAWPDDLPGADDGQELFAELDARPGTAQRKEDARMELQELLEMRKDYEETFEPAQPPAVPPRRQQADPAHEQLRADLATVDTEVADLTARADEVALALGERVIVEADQLAALHMENAFLEALVGAPASSPQPLGAGAEWPSVPTAEGWCARARVAASGAFALGLRTEGGRFGVCDGLLVGGAGSLTLPLGTEGQHIEVGLRPSGQGFIRVDGEVAWEGPLEEKTALARARPTAFAECPRGALVSF